MQSVSIQFGTHSNEIVLRLEDGFNKFLQGTHSGVWLPFYHVYQGPSALRLPTVFVHARRGDPKNVFGPILGDIQ